jgi:excisionase family DNA binding protein
MTSANTVDDALVRAFNELRAALSTRQQATEPPEGAPPLFASAQALGRLAFTPDEAAKVLGLPGAWTVRRLIQTGKLRARTTGARYIIPGSALVEFLDGADAPMGAGGAG